MRRKLSLLFALLLLLAYTAAARASAVDLPSRERNDGEITVNEDGVPLIEFPESGAAPEAVSSGAPYLWLAAAGLVLVFGAAAGVVIHRRRKLQARHDANEY